MYQAKPEWLKIKAHSNQSKLEVEELLGKLSLHTVCEEANCPNMMECFGNKTATFMILGRVCTRNCTFCNVSKGTTEVVDPSEPWHVAQAVIKLGLKHAVITSVTRDDLEDGGASHFAAVITEIRKLDDKVVIEVLVPDFQGSLAALEKVINAKPDILNHNIETVPRLYKEVRPMAIYERSLKFLNDSKLLDNTILTKSGIMVGLGEEKHEVLETMEDLRKNHCDLLTIGQYLPPSKKHHPLVEYVHPDVFEEYKLEALEMGFRHVASGPLVRSSYQAHKAIG
ncbi:lipoyl synthase [Desulfosporosinus sp. BICA1-9]|uniref:lipoyl synthase n=1 Tax=Desulfosporosinus sp. BICA1-9 TaxID=1531958 RepID=UPI00054BDA2A|nr:lipoyl synthase [Desulfosporosinus sp. BICA1-9]KJS50541.1 MAG: lipoyl synthase [Peptococcaceae bacterium BRH_c23]KJS82808.1 MAG: lipoyl synthase [Desulfosporosinus sp. BICA1-9]